MTIRKKVTPKQEKIFIAIGRDGDTWVAMDGENKTVASNNLVMECSCSAEYFVEITLPDVYCVPNAPTFKVEVK